MAPAVRLEALPLITMPERVPLTSEPSGSGPAPLTSEPPMTEQPLTAEPPGAACPVGDEHDLPQALEGLGGAPIGAEAAGA